ncbi:MAG: cell division protein ZapA [Acidiferrobacterales bacterium]
MKGESSAISVNILGKEFMVACSEEERAGLIDAAKFLDEKMKEIHNTGRVLGTERCAVMAALNITHELLQCQNEGIPQEMGDRIRALQAKIDDALRDGAQPPL